MNAGSRSFTGVAEAEKLPSQSSEALASTPNTTGVPLVSDEKIIEVMGDWLHELGHTIPNHVLAPILHALRDAGYEVVEKLDHMGSILPECQFCHRHVTFACPDQGYASLCPNRHFSAAMLSASTPSPEKL